MNSQEPSQIRSLETEPADIVLLTGFLGSGKTTLLKNILAWKGNLAGVAVVVNEFGPVGLDGLLLEGFGGEMIELANGCICCSLRVDLVLAMRDLARLGPRLVLIEATGVAQPGQVVEALGHRELAGMYRIKKIVTVLDASLWEAREIMGPLFWGQLRQADLILLNKTEELDGPSLKRRLEELALEIPHSMVLPTEYCDVDPEVLFADSPITPSRNIPGNISLEQAEPEFRAFVFSTSKTLSEKRLKGFLANVSADCFRIKGVVNFPDRSFFLNFTPGRPDWRPWERVAETRLVLIGRGLDEEAILENLQDCLEE